MGDGRRAETGKFTVGMQARLTERPEQGNRSGSAGPGHILSAQLAPRSARPSAAVPSARTYAVRRRLATGEQRRAAAAAARCCSASRPRTGSGCAVFNRAATRQRTGGSNALFPYASSRGPVQIATAVAPADGGDNACPWLPSSARVTFSALADWAGWRREEGSGRLPASVPSRALKRCAA